MMLAWKSITIGLLVALSSTLGHSQVKNEWEAPEVSGVPNGREFYFKDIAFPDESKGWLIDHFGVLLKSIDGGSSWALAKNFESRKLSSIKFVTSDIGFIAGGWDAEDGKKYQCFVGRTRDAGKTWEDVSPLARGTRTCHLWDLYFVDADLGWTVGVAQRPNDPIEKGIVFRTVDGGRSWKQIDKEVENAGEIFAVEFESRSTGFAASNTGVWKTSDGGESWVRVYDSKKEHLFDVSLIDQKIWAVGSNGLIISSENSGRSWQTSALPANLADLWFAKISVDANGRLWVLGGLSGENSVLTSSSGGRSWTRETVINSTGFLRSIAFRNANCVVLTGATDLLMRRCP